MSSMIQTKSAINVVSVKQFCREKEHNVSLEKTMRLGYFSFHYNDRSVYNQDKSALRYLDLPDPVSINCLQGYQPNVRYGHKQPKGSNLLKWILENETIVSNLNYDFICNNGILKDIMISSFQTFDWNFSAAKIRGKIVVNRITSIEETEKIDEQSERRNRSSYAADALQRLITKKNNGSECKPGKQIDSFYGVFHSKIGSHRILHSGYLDCVESKQELDKPFDDMKFVLTKKFNSPKETHSTLQANIWWSLAVLAGVDSIVRAKCERNFTVKNIIKLPVANLINKGRKMRFFATLNSILDHIKEIVTDENISYEFHFNGKDKKMTGYKVMDIDDNLIPSWYIDGQLPLQS